MIFNQSGGSASPTLQTKTVSPSTSSQLIVPDAGFDALSQVTVNAAPLQAKTATIGSSQTIIKPDNGQYGLSQVTVPAAALQSKTVTPSSSYQTITPSSGYYGLSSVGVSAVALQSKTVAPAPNSRTIKPDSGYIGLSSVRLEPGSMTQALISNTDISWTILSSTWRMTFQTQGLMEDAAEILSPSFMIVANTNDGNVVVSVCGQLGYQSLDNTIKAFAYLINEDRGEMVVNPVQVKYEPRGSVKPNLEFSPLDINLTNTVRWDSLIDALTNTNINSLSLMSQSWSGQQYQFGSIFYHQ